MTKNFWGVKFRQYGRVLKPGEVLKIMEVNDQAYAEFKRAKTNYDAAVVLGVVGGFLVGWPLGTAAGGGDPQWGLAAAGGGLILLAIPLNSGFVKHARSAVAIYNGTDAGGATGLNVHIVPHGLGARVVLRF